MSDRTIAVQGPFGEKGSIDSEPPLEPVKPDAERQLNGIHEQFRSFHEVTGEWPAGTVGDASLPEDGRFSWLAQLANRQNPNGIQPRWNHRWNDSENDRFVRQRQDSFLNPAIPQKVGKDGYPASHFAGVTGVGPDAASLPTGHPRAGMFGTNRVTTLDNVSDGLGNTMLVAGVEGDLGSWAAAGRSTMRGFTEEPFVRGPDGFGTGQADGMFVLMADGSTRFLSAKTDPTVLRRLASAADGLPLDAAVAGDLGVNNEAPLEMSDAAEPAPARIEDIVAELAEPLDEPFTENDQLVDIEATMAQSITEFEQKNPVAARQLLLILEEMLGVKIDGSDLPEDVKVRLDQTVSLHLRDTTAGDILVEVLKQIRLSYVVQNGRLELSDPGE
ncbi:MAG: hypothetical protein KDA86_17455 [Planctomycetaceae bacterium]|nr:hypothetical protein [Planctomycetaceae bacterium]